MDNYARIHRVSKGFRIILLIFLLLSVVGIIAYWIFYNSLPSFIPRITAPLNLPIKTDQLPAINRVYCFLAGLVPMAVHAGILLTLIQLFRLYEKKEILSEKNVRCYRILGFLFIARMISGILYQTLLVIALTITNSPGQRQLTVALSSGDLFSLGAGFFIILISWVMDEGRKISDEQKLVI